MTTTQINSVSLVANVGVRTNGAGKESTDGSFASMMSTSISNRTEKVSAVKEASNTPEKVKETEQAEAKQPEAMTEKVPAGEETKLQETVSREVENSETMQLPEETVVVTETDLSKGLMEMAAKLLEQIKELAQDILNLDEAELNQLMEQLGVTMVDLLNPQVLQQLVVEAAGGVDFSVLLMDEGAGNKLQQLLNGVQELLNQANVTAEELQTIVRSEDFRQVLQTMEQNMPEVVMPETESVQQELKQSITGSETGKSELVEAVDEKTKAVDNGSSEESFSVEVVRESSEENHRATSDQTTGQEPQFAMTQAEQFLERLAQVSEASFADSMTPAELVREIADQLLEKIRVTLQPNQTSMEITLNPESLGKVNLNIVSKQGIMTAQFTTQTEAARIAIESQMNVLRENLQNQGLKVDAIEVTVSNFEFQQGNLNDTASNGEQQNANRGTARRNLTLEEALSFDEVTEEESIALDMMERNGNQVDFKA